MRRIIVEKRVAQHYSHRLGADMKCQYDVARECYAVRGETPEGYYLNFLTPAKAQRIAAIGV